VDRNLFRFPYNPHMGTYIPRWVGLFHQPQSYAQRTQQVTERHLVVDLIDFEAHALSKIQDDFYYDTIPSPNRGSRPRVGPGRQKSLDDSTVQRPCKIHLLVGGGEPSCKTGQEELLLYHRRGLLKGRTRGSRCGFLCKRLLEHSWDCTA
jgi:hypothetical protein